MSTDQNDTPARVESYPTREPKRRMVTCLVFSKPVRCVDETVTELNRAPMALLVRKTKPQWQAGLWNGPGGEANFGESSAHAATRELQEETRLDVSPSAWRHVATLDGPTFVIKLMTHTLRPGRIHLTPPDPKDCGTHGYGPEFYRWYASDQLPPDIVPDLRWLVPLAFDERFFPAAFTVRPDTRSLGGRPVIGGKETDTPPRSDLMPDELPSLPGNYC